MVIYINIDSLSLHIFVIGGNGSGESIVILVLSDNRVIFSMVIDSCATMIEDKQVILPLKVLHHYNVKKIDCLAWTHPHDDHSIGMDDIIKAYYGKRSIAILPKQLYGDNRNIVNLSACCNKVLKAFNHTFKKKNLKSIDCQEGEMRTLLDIPLTDSLTGITKKVTLNCLSPLAEKLDDKIRNGQQLSQSQLNELSLTLVLNFDGYCFYFGGDAPDAVITKTNSEAIGQSRWIKIPHHGSVSSKKLLEMLYRHIDSAACTVFASKNLPNEEVVKEYSNRTDYLYITQQADNNTKPFGMIEYEYHFDGPEICLKIKSYGNTYKNVKIG